MNAIFKFIKRPLGIALIIFIIAGIFVYFYFIRKPAALPQTVVAKMGTVIQEVSVTGKTKPAKNFDLAYEQGGKVKSANVEVGDRTFAGQILIELDSSELYAQLAEAEANVQIQEAKLADLEIGTRPEEIKVSETKVSNAKASLEDARKNLIDKIQDAYTKSEDAVRNKVDQYFSNPRSTNPALNFTAPDAGLGADIINTRVNIEFTLVSWKTSLNTFDTSSNLDLYLTSARNNLNQMKLFLEKNALVLNSLSATPTFSQTTIDAYRSAISTARTNVNTAITNLQMAEEKLNGAQSDVLLAEKELDLEKAGSTLEQISAQESLLKQAEASADIIKVKIGKTILRSPIDGIITKQDAKVGEIISANTSVVSIISLGGFEIEANVPEADIAKLHLGDSAKVTLDAFGSDVVFDAKVTKIDPGETIIEGVATYKITLQFVKEREGVKSGMTANIDVLTAKKENVIVVPQRAVISKDSEKIVRILNDDVTIKEVKIKTGLRGSDGNIEIIEGIKEGDKVVISSNG